MSLIVCWLVFPAVMLALTLGCGLLVERLGGVPLPGVLLPPVGLAAVVAIAGLFTMSDATAELATPACVLAAIAGYVFGDRARIRNVDGWALAAAVGVFLVYGAPIILTGHATFAGYIKLDDASTWMALTDRAMSHGRSLGDLAPSTHEAAVQLYMDSGYPLGTFLPWGVGRALVGQDLAWVFQPYEAFLAAMLTLATYPLVRRVVERRALAAAAAFVGGQSTLLLGYSLWGGVKEVMAAFLIALVAALVAWSLDVGPPAFRRPLALATASAAVLTSQSVGGAFWIVVVLAGALLLLWRRTRDTRALVRPVTAFLILGGLLAIPALALASTFIETAAGLGSSVTEPKDALGNLLRPLRVWQVFGIWPAGDFRVDPEHEVLTVALIPATVVAAVLGLYFAFRAKAHGLLLYVGTAVVGCVLVAGYGSPWVDAKGFATASPALLLAAAAGAAALMERGRAVGRVLAVALLFGVVWSNALAYHDANISPRDQLRELEAIGQDFAGDGPALITEYQTYGARHFLRELDPEGASELRRRIAPLRATGQGVPKGGYSDIDEFRSDALLPYKTLIIRKSATESRPPSEFDLVRSGTWYEVWQRRKGSRPAAEHLPLGTSVEPSGVAACADVQRLATKAGPGGRLATVFRAPVTAVSTAALSHPTRWDDPAAQVLYPKSSGTATGTVQLPGPGRYQVWLGGSIRSKMEVRVDGRRVGALRGILNNTGGYSRYGAIDLGPGEHSVALRYAGPDVAPGSAGQAYPLGPLVVATQTTPREVTYVPVAAARSLCGKKLDWIEAIPADGG